MPECWRCPVIDLCRYKPKTLPPEERRRLNPAPLEPGAKAVSSSYCESPGSLGRRRQVVIELDPLAFPEIRRSVAADRDQVHRDAAENRQRELAGECRALRREAAQVSVGISDVEDRGLGIRYRRRRSLRSRSFRPARIVRRCTTCASTRATCRMLPAASRRGMPP